MARVEGLPDVVQLGGTARADRCRWGAVERSAAGEVSPGAPAGSMAEPVVPVMAVDRQSSRVLFQPLGAPLMDTPDGMAPPGEAVPVALALTARA